MSVNTADDVIHAIRARLTAERLERINAVLALEITGDTARHYTLDARPGGRGLLDGAPAEHALTPRLTAAVTEDNLVRIARGELKPQVAALTGKLKLRGDLSFVPRLASLF